MEDFTAAVSSSASSQRYLSRPLAIHPVYILNLAKAVQRTNRLADNIYNNISVRLVVVIYVHKTRVPSRTADNYYQGAVRLSGELFRCAAAAGDSNVQLKVLVVRGCLERTQSLPAVSRPVI